MKTINTKNNVYELYWVAGKVMSAGKNMETVVQGGGGGSYGNGYTAPVRITSKTTVHDQIFVLDREGKEHAFQLQDFNLACRDGNEVSVIWAVKKGNESGPYVIVHNRTTSQTFFHEKRLFKMLGYNGLYTLGICILSVCLYKILPLWYVWPFVAVFVWRRLSNQEVRRFKAETDFGSFN